MWRGLFWLSDEAWPAIEPHLPKNQPGARRVDDRLVISGIIHMLKCGGRWADVPPAYGPPTTVYNRWNRWSRRGLWSRILSALTEEDWVAETATIDSSYVKAHRSAGGAKGGSGPGHWRLAWRSDNEDPRPCRRRRPAAPPDPDTRQHLGRQGGGPADRRGALQAAPGRAEGQRSYKGYDANALRAKLKAQGTIPVIPGRSNRKRPIQYDKLRYRDRWRIEAMFCRLKDFRRIATRYDKLARNYLSAVHLVAAIAFWC